MINRRRVLRAIHYLTRVMKSLYRSLGGQILLVVKLKESMSPDTFEVAKESVSPDTFEVGDHVLTKYQGLLLEGVIYSVVKNGYAVELQLNSSSFDTLQGPNQLILVPSDGDLLHAPKSESRKC